MKYLLHCPGLPKRDESNLSTQLFLLGFFIKEYATPYFDRRNLPGYLNQFVTKGPHLTNSLRIANTNLYFQKQFHILIFLQLYYD
eukprot:UN23998